MTTPNPLAAEREAVRRKCVEANPHIQTGEPVKLTWDTGDVEYRTPYRPIRLADVLLAYREKGDKDESISQERWEQNILHTTLRWSLRQDSLDAQSDDTIHFLYQLLCPNGH